MPRSPVHLPEGDVENPAVDRPRYRRIDAVS